MVFSVADYSVWDIFSWELFLISYGIAIILVIFPKSSSIWPLSSFSLLTKFGRWNGVAAFAFISIIAVPHFFGTYFPLQAQKEAFAADNFNIIEAVYEGRQPDKKIALQALPENTLLFDGEQYEVPGSLHGSVNFLPEIRGRLILGQTYKLSVSEGVILEILSMN